MYTKNYSLLYFLLCISKCLIIYLHAYTQTHIKDSDIRGSREWNKVMKTYNRPTATRLPCGFVGLTHLFLIALFLSDESNHKF